MANATPPPIVSGRSNAHRLLMSTPATRATVKIRMMVMARNCGIKFRHCPYAPWSLPKLTKLAQSSIYPHVDRFRSFLFEPSNALGDQIEHEGTRTPFRNWSGDCHPDGLARRNGSG